MEIIVMSGGAVEPGLDYVAAAFREKTGCRVSIHYNMGALGIKRMDEGAIVDVVVATSDSMTRNFRPAGKVEEGGVNIGRVGLGMMARAGTPLPDISTAVALKRTLLEADAVLYTEEASGLYVEEMIRKLKIYEQVEPKTTRFRNGPDLMDQVLQGSGRKFGFLPVTAIRTYQAKGVVLVGPLPAEVQCYLEFIAVPAVRSTNKELAWAFVRYCGGPGKPLLVAHGVQ